MRRQWSLAFGLCAAFTLATSLPAQGKGHGGGGGGGQAKGGGKSEHQQAGGQHGGGKASGQREHAQREHPQSEHPQGGQSATRRQAPSMGGGGVARGQNKEPAASRGEGRAEHGNAPEKLTGRANAESRKVEDVGGDVNRSAFGSRGLGRGRFIRELDFNDIAPPARSFVVSARPGERLVGKAVALAFARGVGDDALVIVPTGTRYLVRNRTGDVLLDLDEEHARDPGYWHVVTADNHVDDKAPSFCRSGAGHPVWGRQWCLDKGFGLGTENDVRWGRVIDGRNVVFLQQPTGNLTYDVLRSVLGDVVLNRLGLHAVTLGYTDPLTGQWLGEPTGPRVLLLTSGGHPVAELVDTNRDNTADNVIVALRPW